MNLKSIVWKKQNGRFTNGDDATIGRIKVGSIHWNSIDRDDSKRYVANCTLPNIKNQGLIGKYPTEKEAMAEVERVVYQWFEEVEFKD